MVGDKELRVIESGWMVVDERVVEEDDWGRRVEWGVDLGGREGGSEMLLSLLMLEKRFRSPVMVVC